MPTSIISSNLDQVIVRIIHVKSRSGTLGASLNSRPYCCRTSRSRLPHRFPWRRVDQRRRARHLARDDRGHVGGRQQPIVHQRRAARLPDLVVDGLLDEAFTEPTTPPITCPCASKGLITVPASSTAASRSTRSNSGGRGVQQRAGRVLERGGARGRTAPRRSAHARAPPARPRLARRPVAGRERRRSAVFGPGRSSDRSRRLRPMQFPINEPVADAPNVDHELVAAVAAQLPPQPVSVAVERPGVPEGLQPPDAAHQLRAGEHPRRLAGERDQQVVLLGRQLDRPVGTRAPRASARRSRSGPPAGSAPPRRISRAPQHRGDPGAQLRVGKRLLDEVVAAALEHPDPLQPVGVAAQHDQRRVGVGPAGGPLAGADRVEQLERLAVDVDEDQVRLRGAQQRERLRPVGRDQHPVAVGGEVVGEERARGVVLLGTRMVEVVV